MWNENDPKHMQMMADIGLPFVGDVVDNKQINAFPKGAGCKGAGCDIAPKRDEPVQEKTKDETEAEKLGVTVEKYRAMIHYARSLVQNHPGIKPKRVSQLVKKKFNIKTT